MKIVESDCKSKICDGCLNKKENKKIILDGLWLYLCDKCLQELNYKIVEHLADKNL